MKKKIIRDIRLYKSWLQDESGTWVTTSFGDKKLKAVTNRIVMKLRENGFSFGEFDHLYLNFTPCGLAAEMSLSDEIDRYHPWYRYCTVPVENGLHRELGSPETRDSIIHWIRTVLFTFFSSEDFNEALILSCVQQAVEQGEDMLMQFKEKVTAKRRAVIYLRYLDTCRFYPLLRVYNPEEHLLFEHDLPETLTLDYLGDLQVSAKRVTIKPRKNACTAQHPQLVFDY